MAASKTKFHTQYDHNPGKTLDCSSDPGRTQQHFKKECDPNEIVKKFIQTGDPTPFVIDPEAQAFEVPISGADFQTAMNEVALANTMFEELPSNLRNKFENSPEKYLNYVQEQNEDGSLANLQEMYELGMAVMPTEEAPQQVQVTNIDQLAKTAETAE